MLEEREQCKPINSRYVSGQTRNQGGHFPPRNFQNIA